MIRRLFMLLVSCILFYLVAYCMYGLFTYLKRLGPTKLETSTRPIKNMATISFSKSSNLALCKEASFFVCFSFLVLGGRPAGGGVSIGVRGGVGSGGSYPFIFSWTLRMW